MISYGNENGMVMPVSPMGGGYGNGCGGFGNDWGSWIILFLIFGMFGRGGWGNNNAGSDGSFPWLLNADNRTSDAVQAGFNQAATSGQLTSIQNSLASAEVANCQRTIESIKTDYQNQIAGMNQRFADNTAMNGRICDLQASISNLKSELLTVYNQGIQSIKDDLCADRLALAQSERDAERRENDRLRAQLNTQTTIASMNQGFANEVDALYNRLNSCPVPTTPVYGRTPIFTCNNQNNPYNVGCPCNNGQFIA